MTKISNMATGEAASCLACGAVQLLSVCGRLSWVMAWRPMLEYLLGDRPPTPLLGDHASTPALRVPRTALQRHRLQVRGRLSAKANPCGCRACNNDSAAECPGAQAAAADDMVEADAPCEVTDTPPRPPGASTRTRTRAPTRCFRPTPMDTSTYRPPRGEVQNRPERNWTDYESRRVTGQVTPSATRTYAHTQPDRAGWPNRKVAIRVNGATHGSAHVTAGMSAKGTCASVRVRWVRRERRR